MDGPAVVVTQPTTVRTQHAGEKPNNYVVASVINLICCFFLLGIIALIFSLQVDSAWSSGNYEEARRNANIAKILNVIGFIIGSLTWVGALVFFIISLTNSSVAVSSGTSTTNLNTAGGFNTYYY